MFKARPSVSCIHLHRGRRQIGIIQCPDRDFNRSLILVRERRPAVETKASLVGGRTLKQGPLATRPDEAVGLDERCKETAEGLLAHSAVADRSNTQTFNSKTDRAALASTGKACVWC